MDFMNGGCAILADALHLWSEGRLHQAAVSYSGRIDHVVATDGDVFLDRDGAFTREGFSRKSALLYGDADVEIGEGPWAPGDEGIARDADVSRWIAAELRDMLPDPSGLPWR